jgi:G-patch domain
LTRRTEFLRSDIRADKAVKATPQAGKVIGQEWAQMSTMKGTKAKAMMEKMGWKEGEALGSETNKGIAEPIQQVYRYSKAGLG